jgi:hypothetical protein
MNVRSSRVFPALTLIAVLALSSALHDRSIEAQAQTRLEPLGMFDGDGDVGTVLHAGRVHYDGPAEEGLISLAADPSIWEGFCTG